MTRRQDFLKRHQGKPIMEDDIEKNIMNWWLLPNMHISNQKAKTLSNTFIIFEEKEMNDHIVSCLDIDKLLKLTNCFLMTLCGFHSIPAHTAGLIALLLCWKQNHPTPK